MTEPRIIEANTLRALSLAAALLGQPAGAEITAPNFSAYLTLATDYRLRGVSQTDEGLALQAGVDFEHDTGIFAGIWASNVDFARDQAHENPRDIELDYYLGLIRPVAGDWSADVVVVRYSYPNSSVGYDYFEYGAGVNYAERIFVDAAYTDELFGHDIDNFTYQLGWRFPFGEGFEFGGTLGFNDGDEPFPGSYWFWDFGLSHAFFERLAFDVRYYDTDDDARTVFGSIAGSRIVLSVSVAL